MQSLGPVARPGFLRSPDYERWAHAGLGGGNHNKSCIGCRGSWVLERCWPGSMSGTAEFVRASLGSGLAFGEIFAHLVDTYVFAARPCTSMEVGQFL